MMKSKATYIGAVVATVAALAIIAGLGVHATAGAGTDTDAPAPVLHVPTSLEAPTPPAAQPPASPSEPVGAPAANPTGNDAGVNNGPAGLPDAGTGPTAGSNALAEVLVILGIAGMALVGTGAAISTRRGS